MAYVLEIIPYKDIAGHQHYDGRLHEYTKAELKALRANPSTTSRYETISAARAHRYVREDIIHTTPLWIDDLGRIRRS